MSDQYAAGMRRAAEMFHQEQVLVWVQDIVEGLGFADVLKIESYDDNIAAHEVIEVGLCRIRDAIPAPFQPPPEAERRDGFRCLIGWDDGDWRTGIWQTFVGGGGAWHDVDGRRRDNPTSFASLPDGC